MILGNRLIEGLSVGIDRLHQNRADVQTARLPVIDRRLHIEAFNVPHHLAHRAKTEHDNGLGYLNGGIIGTVLDCHSAAAVVLEVDRRGWREPGDAPLPFVTAGMDIRYRRPAPLHETSWLRAIVIEPGPDEMTVEVELAWDGKPRATATARWKRWRPR